MPVLAINREKASAGIFSRQMKLVANDWDRCGAEDTGHWVMEERWKETRAALAKLL